MLLGGHKPHFSGHFLALPICKEVLTPSHPGGWDPRSHPAGGLRQLWASSLLPWGDMMDRVGRGGARRGCLSVGTCPWLLAQLIPLELAGSSHRCSTESGTGMEPGGWGSEVGVLRGCPAATSSSSSQGWRAHPTLCEPMLTPGPALLPPPASPWLSPTTTTGTWRSSSTPVVRGNGALGGFGADGASSPNHPEHLPAPEA